MATGGVGEEGLIFLKFRSITEKREHALLLWKPEDIPHEHHGQRAQTGWLSLHSMEHMVAGHVCVDQILNTPLPYLLRTLFRHSFSLLRHLACHSPKLVKGNIQYILISRH